MTALLLIGIPEVLEEVWDVVSEHVVHRLDHLRLQLLELVDAVAAQNLFEVLYAGEIPRRQMELSLDLLDSL